MMLVSSRRKIKSSSSTPSNSRGVKHTTDNGVWFEGSLLYGRGRGGCFPPARAMHRPALSRIVMCKCSLTVKY